MSFPPLLAFTPRVLLHLLHQLHRLPHSTPSTSSARPPDLPSHSPLLLSKASSILFVDIIGFTTLTESFVSVGLSGLEDLTGLLSLYFTALLEIIGAHEGDLLKVAGDALIVAFYDENTGGGDTSQGKEGKGEVDDDDPHHPHHHHHHSRPSQSPLKTSPSPSPTTVDSLSLLCLRAISCALALQSAPTFAAEGVTLRLHIGVACGMTDFIVVGGQPQFWVQGGGGSSGEGIKEEMRAPEGVSAYEERPLSPSSSSSSSVVTSTLPPSLTRSSSPMDSVPTPSSPRSPLSEPPQASLRSSTSLPPPFRPRPLHLSSSDADSSMWPLSISSSGAGGSRWEFLAVGKAFQQLRTAVKESRSGDVVCSSEVWRHLTGLSPAVLVEGEQVPGPSGNFLVRRCESLGNVDVRPPPTPLLLSRMRLSVGAISASRSFSDLTSISSTFSNPLLSLSSFLMPALISRLHTGLSTPSHWLGEYRRVTVLFVSLPNPEECLEPQLEGSSNVFRQAFKGAEGEEVEQEHTSSPPWLRAFHSLFRTLQSHIIRVGGQVRQVLCDDKGCVMIGAFGLIPFAHEDDAVRAVTAALDIVAGVRTHHSHAVSSLSVGVTTGRAWCGAVGSESRKEYTMVGDVVNLSARIMGHRATSQRVLCDSETVKACGSRIRFSPEVVQVSVKGRASALTLSEPVGKTRLSSSASASPPTGVSASVPASFLSKSSLLSPHLVRPLASGPRVPIQGTAEPCDSRQTILNALIRLVDSSVSAPFSAPFIVLEGGAGQGKTFLARQTVDYCRCNGVMTLMGGADSMEANCPFFAITAILQDIVQKEFDRLSSPNAATAATSSSAPLTSPASPTSPTSSIPSTHSPLLTLQSLLPPADRPRISLLYPYLPECFPSPPEPCEGVEASMRPGLTLRFMRALLTAHFTRHPRSILVVEDGHWLDLQSWTWLKEVIELLPSVLVLLTCRPITPPESTLSPSPSPPSTSLSLYSAICQHSRCRRFVLSGLDHQTAATLAISFLRCRALTHPLITTIHERSDGIPLFIQHLCQYMLEQGYIRIDEGTGLASLNDRLLADATLPTSLEGLLASVLDRLDPQCQLALKVASVVGRHFACSLVTASHPMNVSMDVVQKMMAAAKQDSVVMEEERGSAVTSDDEEDTWDLHYRFTHQLVRDAAYSALLYHQRRDLHARVANSLVNLLRMKTGTPTHRLSSTHLIAHHYWLALCNADDVLIDDPDQRLVESAVYHLLLSADNSFEAGAIETSALLLTRAIQCIHLLVDVKQREWWELRWLCKVLGNGDAMQNSAAVVIKLGREWSPRKKEEEVLPPYVRSTKFMCALAERALALLASPAAIRDLSFPQVQDHRFNALCALWVNSIPSGPVAVSAVFNELNEMAENAQGTEAEYYQLEVFRAAVPFYAMIKDSTKLYNTFLKMEKHPLFLTLFSGQRMLNRFALGYTPMARLVSELATFQWVCGRVNTSMQTLNQIMPPLLRMEHPMSITQGWTNLMRSAGVCGAHPISIDLLQQAVAAFPSEDTTATHVRWVMRRCCQMFLRVWAYPAGTSEEVTYESDLVALLALLIEQIPSFGLEYHQIVYSFPFIADFRPEMPLRAHEAVWALVEKKNFGYQYTFPRWEMEIRRMKAALIVRKMKVGEGQWEEEVKEAERLLTEADEIFTYEKTVHLKTQMTWGELRWKLGRREEAMKELKEALDGIEEGPNTESFYVVVAQQVLRKMMEEDTQPAIAALE